MEILGFDESKYYLGKLCPFGHEFETSGLSVRRKDNYGCNKCHLTRSKASSLKRQGKLEEAQNLLDSITQVYDEQVIDGEIWKDVFDYERLYQVSNWGRVKSLYVNRILLPTPADQYSHVTLRKNGERKTLKVHRLVAIAFLEPPMSAEEWQVNHKNGIRNDNRVVNLEWCTQKENIQHAFANIPRKKLIPPKGEKHHSAKLNDAEIEEIRSLKGLVKGVELAKRYGVCASLITKIQKGVYRACVNPVEQSN